MTIVSPMGQLRPVFADKNGKRLSGGKVFTYEPGTLTPKATYTDALNLIPNTNPINLDESGEADIYLDGGYRMQVYDRYGALIQDVDNFRTWASGIPAESIFYGGQDLKRFNAGVESSLNNRYTKEETYSKSEVDTTFAAYVGGRKAYTTLALAQADQVNLPANTAIEVTNDGANNGTYQWNGTTLTKSDYDQLTQAKNYSDSKLKVFSIYKKTAVFIDCYISEDGFTRLKSVIENDQSIVFDTRLEESVVDISDLKSKVDGQSFYKKIIGIASIYLDEDGSSRLKEETITAKFTSYISTEQKQLIAGAGISLLETEQSITIEASDIVYETPHEYVLCLIAGQSNASYYGGDAALAPQIPNNVCFIWDNAANTLREINDGSGAATTCKQTYGPALALEFYKQTGMGLIIVNSAVGSTAQVAAADNGAGNWDVSGTLRQTAVNRFNACKTYLDNNAYCYQSGFVCWTQGERDGQEIQIGTITKEQYKTALSTMIDFFKTSLGSKLPFILTTTAYYASSGDNVGSKAVRAAQMETAHEKSGAYVGYTGAVKFFERGLIADSVHYNQIGKNIIGKQLAKISSKLSAGVN